MQFTTEPDNTTVTVGADATLNCAVSGLDEGAEFRPSWFKSGQALSSGRDVGGHPRYSLTGKGVGDHLISSREGEGHTTVLCRG